MTEDQLEQETLNHLADVGYTVISGYDIAPDGISPERKNYVEVLLICQQ
jgi:type I restriction enzyme R subunit